MFVRVLLLTTSTRALFGLTTPFVPRKLPSVEQVEKNYIDLFNVPDQTHNACPVVAGQLRSEMPPQAKRTKFQFHNGSPGPAHIYWLDAKGESHLRDTVPSGELYGVETAEGHAFRVWNEDHSIVLLDYVAGRIPLGSRSFSRKARNEPAPPNAQIDPELSELDWNNARQQGFVNRMGVPIDLYYISDNAESGAEERLVAQLQADEVHYEVTYHMHTFRAREHESGRIVTQTGIYDVEIPDCLRRRPQEACTQRDAEAQSLHDAQKDSSVSDPASDSDTNRTSDTNRPRSTSWLRGAVSALDVIDMRFDASF